MDNKPKGYGMSADIQNRINAKYSNNDELELMSWVAAVTKTNVPAGKGPKVFKDWLEDGLLLCQLANAIIPGCKIKVADYTQHKMEAMINSRKNENVEKFLTEIKGYGVKNIDLFQTVDLRLGGNLALVQTTLFKLASIHKTNNPDGENTLGVKVSTENKRVHTEEDLRKGRNVIGLQMGTNQVCSQEGMTAYGTPRQTTQK